MSASEKLPADLLLAQQGYLHALARELVFDPHAVRDVEQEVLLAALAHGPRDHGALRGWLAALVRNMAHKTWRSSARRNRREEACARPEASVPSASEILEREETRRSLVEAVLALEEPLRDVLVLRYLEELPPRAVAARLGLSLDTVHDRARHGLAKLRARFDRESHGDRAAWCVALVRKFGAPFARAGLGSVVSTTIGVIAMGLVKKSALALGVLALAVAGWRFARPEARSSSAESNVAAKPAELVRGVRAAEESTTPAATDARTVAPATPSASLEAPSAPTTGALRLRATWWDGTPAQDVAATIHPSGAEDFEADTVSVRTGADGTCVVGDLAPGRTRAYLDRDLQSGEADVRAGETAELALTIPRGFDARGIVVERDGTPVPDADVLLDPTGGGWMYEHRVARTDHDGRFFARSIGDGLCWISARAAGRAPSPRYVLTSGSGAVLDVRITMPGPGGALAGTIRDAEGHAVVDAQVLVGDVTELSLAHVDVPEDVQAVTPPGVRASADELGRFAIDGLAEGTRMVRVRARDHAPWTSTVEITAGRTETLEVALLPEARVEGSVRDASGKPLAQIEVATAGSTFLGRSTYSRADGSFVLRGLPAEEFELVADGETLGRARTTLFGASGAMLRWDAVLDGGLSIRGRVVAPGLDPTLLDVRCERILASGEYTLLNARPDASGAFTIGGLADEEYDLSIEPRLKDVYPFPLASLRAVRPGPDEVEVPVDARAWPSVHLQGRVVDAHGTGLPGVSFTASLEGHTNGPLLTTDEDGLFDLGPYPPGRWTLVVRPPGKAELRLGPLELAADATHDFGDLVVE